MNEAETRAELIEPKLEACGWGVVEGSKILREYNITKEKVQYSLPLINTINNVFSF